MILPDKIYDICKWLVQIVFPAIGACYAALAALWGFPYAEQIVGSISAICVLLGACLRISNSNYNGDGVLTVNSDLDDDDENKYNVAFNKDLSELANKKQIMVTVNKA